MKKINMIIVSFLFVNMSFSQNLETVGAGVIDFLLSNPKTANRMNTSDAIGLDIIGNLLNTAGKRKHELNVANAGQQQIILNDNSGRQATVVLDPEGNVYVLYNGVVYPINQEMVNKAKEDFVPKHEIKNEYLPPYDLDEIRNKFVFEEPKPEKIDENQVYKVTNKDGEYMSEIVKKLDLSVEDLKLIYYHGHETKEKIAMMKQDELKVKYGTRFEYTKFLLETKIPFVFTCKWVKDFDDNGLDFDDFQGIKNSFLKDEKILFVLGYQTEEENCTYTLEIYEFNTGNLLFRREGDAINGQMIISEEITAQVLEPGSYIFSFKLKTDEKTMVSQKERFEIRNE